MSAEVEGPRSLEAEGTDALHLLLMGTLGQESLSCELRVLYLPATSTTPAPVVVVSEVLASTAASALIVSLELRGWVHSSYSVAPQPGQHGATTLFYLF